MTTGEHLVLHLIFLAHLGSWLFHKLVISYQYYFDIKEKERDDVENQIISMENHLSTS